MKLKRTLFIFLLAVVMAMPSGAAFADGFSIYEWSAGGVAMGGAYMFAEDDPSLLAFNPAGITRLEGDWLGGSISAINPRGDVLFHGYANEGATSHTSEAIGYVPALYYTHQHNDRLWWGLGIFPRFGNSTEYDSNFPGRYNSYYAKISAITVQPTLAYKISPKLTAAVGADIMYITLDLKRKLPTHNLAYALSKGALNYPDSDFELDGNNTNIGWNLSLNYDFDDKTSIAAVYRSKIKHTMDADAYASFPCRDTGAHGTVTLPDSFTIGIGHKFNDRTRVEAGATYTKWSTFDQLDIYFDQPLLASIPATDRSLSTKNWENSWRYQFGIEHRMDEHWTIMGGLAFDHTVIPDGYVDFMVPTGNRTTYSLGLKYHNKNSIWAFAWGFMVIGDRVIDATQFDTVGRAYTSAEPKNNTAHILSLSYTVKLK